MKEERSPFHNRSISRRGLLASALATAFLAACGGGDDDDESQDQPTVAPGQSLATPTTAPKGPRTITHEYGTFEIPVEPKRVVALDGRPGFEAALALGFKPIAIGRDALADGKLATFITTFDATNVPIINPNEPDIEALLALKPDVIIGRDFQIEASLEKLKVVAPVLPIKIDDTWQVALRRLADWLDVRPHVDAQLKMYDDKLAGINQKHATKIASRKVGLLEYGVSDRTFYRNPRYVQSQTLKDIGGVEPAFLQTVGDKFSVENIGQIDSVEALLVCGFGDAHEKLNEEELWKRVPAVAAGRVVQTDIRTNYGGFYAAMGCLDLWDQVYQKLA